MVIELDWKPNDPAADQFASVVLIRAIREGATHIRLIPTARGITYKVANRARWQQITAYPATEHPRVVERLKFLSRPIPRSGTYFNGFFLAEWANDGIYEFIVNIKPTEFGDSIDIELYSYRY